MTRISASVLFTRYSKLYILTKRSANDVKFISRDRQELDLSKKYSYGTVNSIFVEIQPDSTNIKNDPRTFKSNKIYQVIKAGKNISKKWIILPRSPLHSVP